MVQRKHEERFAISQHYKVREAQPICIHQQSFHFVNKCCLAENVMTKKVFLIFHSYFAIKNKSWENRRMRLKNPRIMYDTNLENWNIILFNKNNFIQRLLTFLGCRTSRKIMKMLIFRISRKVQSKAMDHEVNKCWQNYFYHKIWCLGFSKACQALFYEKLLQFWVNFNFRMKKH